jgi:4-hydroxyphenylacetate 3-monooxygenase/4-hydroxybutyryl-CoA dehydratase/vinylacetyl-CoA-Delta-isomerase
MITTYEEYLESLRRMQPNVYLKGEKIGRDHPAILPAIKKIGLTYELTKDPHWQDMLTAKSHLTGEKINRYCHIYQSVDDMMAIHRCTREFTWLSGGCIQRCGGRDTLNALSVTTYNVDQDRGTDYHKRFNAYLEYFQKNDCVAPIGITDVKGQRNLRPHEQADPDMYLRVVKKTKDGIIVRGAKNPIGSAPIAHELVIAPTRALTKEEGDWAVAFAVPADAKGVIHVAKSGIAWWPRQHLKAPYAEYGRTESFIIFDDVFVPWERVFLCGETEWGSEVGRLTALYHRWLYSACKPATSDLLVGAIALLAEYSGIDKASHIREKIADLIAIGELIYGAGIAAAYQSSKSPSGTMIPNEVFTNVARHHAGVNTYHEFEMLADVAGALGITLPYEQDFVNETTGPLLKKYIMRRPDVPVEKIHRLFRYVQDLLGGPQSSVALVGGIHGGGSPIMEKIALLRLGQIDKKKGIVKRLAGIED